MQTQTRSSESGPPACGSKQDPCHIANSGPQAWWFHSSGHSISPQAPPCFAAGSLTQRRRSAATPPNSVNCHHHHHHHSSLFLFLRQLSIPPIGIVHLSPPRQTPPLDHASSTNQSKLLIDSSSGEPQPSQSTALSAALRVASGQQHACALLCRQAAPFIPFLLNTSTSDHSQGLIFLQCLPQKSAPMAPSPPHLVRPAACDHMHGRLRAQRPHTHGRRVVAAAAAHTAAVARPLTHTAAAAPLDRRDRRRLRLGRQGDGGGVDGRVVGCRDRDRVPRRRSAAGAHDVHCPLRHLQRG